MAEISSEWQGIPRDRTDWAIGFPSASYTARLAKQNHVRVEAKRKLEEMRNAEEDRD